MSESLNAIAIQFWIEAKRQGLIVEYLHFDVTASINGEYRLAGQSIDAKLTENKDA